jgi:AraC family transcriptional regulator of adaptative response / DNA-3-methyladenine glycosylase II
VQALPTELSSSAGHETAAFLAARAVPGIEEAARAAGSPPAGGEAALAAGSPPTGGSSAAGGFRRTVRLAHGPAIVGLRGVVAADPRDRPAAEAAARRLAGADPAAADTYLAADPVLGPLVAARPGLRMPGAVDAGELAVRAVLGQQVSLAAARTLAGRLVRLAGEPLEQPVGALTHLWPRPDAIAAVADRMPMPRARRRTLTALAEALAGGLVIERAALLELPGIGPWTAEYVAMRALGDPDAWLPTDLGVRRGLERLGVGEEAAEAWRPHRTHAVRHVWAIAAPRRAPRGRTRAPAASPP